MKYTATVHIGTSISDRHNRRDRYITNREEHINPNGEYDVIRDEKIQDVYKELFGDAVREHDKKMVKQGHRDRQIKDGSRYYSQVNNDHRKNAAKPAYEMIIQIGDKDNHPEPDEAKQIMLDYVNQFEKDNPNLHVYGIYYHNDEQGGPHMHIDFVPTAHGYEKGMSVRPALAQALYEEDSEYYKNPKDNAQNKRHESAEIKFNQRERNSFRDICKQHGLELEDINHEKREHLDTPEYKKVKAAIDELKQDIEQTTQELNDAKQELSQAQAALKDVRDVEQFASGVENGQIGKNIPLNGSVIISKEDVPALQKMAGIAAKLEDALSDIRTQTDALNARQNDMEGREQEFEHYRQDTERKYDNYDTYLNNREAKLKEREGSVDAEVKRKTADNAWAMTEFLDQALVIVEGRERMKDDAGHLLITDDDFRTYLMNEYGDLDDDMSYRIDDIIKTRQNVSEGLQAAEYADIGYNLCKLPKKELTAITGVLGQDNKKLGQDIIDKHNELNGHHRDRGM